MNQENANKSAFRELETLQKPTTTSVESPIFPEFSPNFPRFSPFFTVGELQNASLTYYLRDKNSDKPTPILARVKIGSHTYRHNTTIKIHPALWDSKQHKCFELGDANESQRRLISRLDLSFREMLHYICNRGEHNPITEEEMKRRVANIFSSPRSSTPGRKKNAPSTNVILELHKVADTRRESTARQYHLCVKAFERYLKETDTAPELSNVDYSLLYQYRNYLTQQDISYSWAKECISRVVTMLKDIASNPAFEYEFDHRITTLQISRTKEGRYADDLHAKHLIFTPQQVKALQALELPTEYQQQTRDLYLLQIFVGCRYSDLTQVLDRSKLVHIDGRPYVKFIDRKEGRNKKTVKYCHAPLWLHPDAFALWDRLSQSQIIANVTQVACYNQALKTICKRCDALQAKVTYLDARNKQVTKYQWQLCSSHAARHTFITNCGKTLTPDQISFFTGHASPDIIAATYLHYTDSVVNSQITEIGRKFEAAQQPTQQPSTSDLLAQFAALTPQQQAQLLGTLSQRQV